MRTLGTRELEVSRRRAHAWHVEGSAMAAGDEEGAGAGLSSQRTAYGDAAEGGRARSRLRVPQSREPPMRRRLSPRMKRTRSGLSSSWRLAV